MSAPASAGRELHLKILGRLLEHLGVQMYKRRDAALAELIANCWDAGASQVSLTVPTTTGDDISIEDNGSGMSFEDIEDHYLVVGQNRRTHGTPMSDATRKPMGRKGIGKLAGFGIARTMTVETWRAGEGVRFTLSIDELKTDDGHVENRIVPHQQFDPSDRTPSGTRVQLSNLKHSSDVDIEALKSNLSRRFSRLVRGRMEIQVNGEALSDSYPPSFFRTPEEDWEEHTLQSGDKVRYWYAFANDVIKNPLLRGFSVLVHGKVGQAPPFFFEVEGTASGQHATRYVFGEIEADYLDDSQLDEDDLVSTDRQELEWGSDRLKELKQWGDELSRKVLLQCTKMRGERSRTTLFQTTDLSDRIEALEKALKEQVASFLDTLSLRDSSQDEYDRLADTLVRAFEFKQFFDVTEDMESYLNDPEGLVQYLSHLKDWKSLESRALFEIIDGRLKIIEKFRRMIADNVPETASVLNKDNLHDAIGRFPWLLDPEWQIFSDEEKLTKLVRELFSTEADDGDKSRTDFIAVSSDHEIIIIELKRSGHAVTVEDYNRLLKYQDILGRTTEKIVRLVLVSSGIFNLAASAREGLLRNVESKTWGTLFDKTEARYKEYLAILGGRYDSAEFAVLEREIAKIRRVLVDDSFHRSIDERKEDKAEFRKNAPPLSSDHE